MDEASQSVKLRVALLADDCERGGFRAFLDGAGVAVVMEISPLMPLPNDWNGADVLLVALAERMDRARIEQLLQLSPVPVLFNRGGVGSGSIWQRRLMSKLQTLADRALPSAQLSVQRNHPELRVVAGVETLGLFVNSKAQGRLKLIAPFPDYRDLQHKEFKLGDTAVMYDDEQLVVAAPPEVQS